MSALTWAVVLQMASMPACTVPGMVPEFWPKVVTIESSYDPWAVKDDTTNRSYYPPTAEMAERIATNLMAAHHSVGVGLSQLTARSEQQFYDKFGMTIHTALDGCMNMKVGAQFYVDRALSIYNSGSPTKSLGYAAAVQSVAVEPATKPAPVQPAVGEPPPVVYIRPAHSGRDLLYSTN